MFQNKTGDRKRGLHDIVEEEIFLTGIGMIRDYRIIFALLYQHALIGGQESQPRTSLLY